MLPHNYSDQLARIETYLLEKEKESEAIRIKLAKEKELEKQERAKEKSRERWFQLFLVILSVVLSYVFSQLN